MPPAPKGKKPSGKDGDQPQQKPPRAGEDQQVPVQPVLRTYCADLVSDEGTFRAFVQAVDEKQARVILEESCANLHTRALWQPTDTAALLALFKAEHML